MRVDVLPLRCLRPTPDRARAFAAPPYDVFDRESALDYVEAHPDSFLSIDRPETGFPRSQDMYAPEVYRHAAELIEGYAADGTLVEDGPSYYLWRLVRRGRSQTGIVAACSLAEYRDGTIARHELTLARKEQDRIDHIAATGYQTGPIFLAYRPHAELAALIEEGCAGEPLYRFTDDQGVEHIVWRVGEGGLSDRLAAALAELEGAYIADGHHRAASAARVGAADDAFLAVLFSADELRIYPYERILHIDGLTAEELEAKLEGASLETERLDGPTDPERREFCATAGGSWIRARVPEELVGEPPVESLDCSLLQKLVLEPVFGIDDPANDRRIAFAGGLDDVAQLAELAGTGVGFALHATSIDELMAVSDAGLLMPQKSTWFEPKLLSGLFLRPIR